MIIEFEREENKWEDSQTPMNMTRSTDKNNK